MLTWTAGVAGDCQLAEATWRPPDWPDQWPGAYGTANWMVFPSERERRGDRTFCVVAPYGLASLVRVPTFPSAKKAKVWCEKQDKRLAGAAGAAWRQQLREAVAVYAKQLSQRTPAVLRGLGENYGR